MYCKRLGILYMYLLLVQLPPLPSNTCVCMPALGFFLDQDKFRYSDLAIHFPPAKTCRNGKRAKAGLQRAFETLGIPCENARTYARSHRTSHRLIFLLPRANGRSHRVLGTGRVRAFFARWCFANRGAIHETRKGNMIKMGLVWFGNGRLHARSGRR